MEEILAGWKEKAKFPLTQWSPEFPPRGKIVLWGRAAIKEESEMHQHTELPHFLMNCSARANTGTHAEEETCTGKGQRKQLLLLAESHSVTFWQDINRISFDLGDSEWGQGTSFSSLPAARTAGDGR